MTKSQIDRLGESLRAGERDENVIRSLDALYDQYEPVAASVMQNVQVIVGTMGFREEPYIVQRPTKTLPSIVAKLNRERSRLSTMQDIIGCRIVVQDRVEQRTLVGSLRPPTQAPPGLSIVWDLPFKQATEINRNINPSSGYRAIHVIVPDYGVPFEIQVRTVMQNRWAQLSERCEDLFPGIKYGIGRSDVQENLTKLSNWTDETEVDDQTVIELDQSYDVDTRMLRRQERRVAEKYEDLRTKYREFEEFIGTIEP